MNQQHSRPRNLASTLIIVCGALLMVPSNSIAEAPMESMTQSNFSKEAHKKEIKNVWMDDFMTHYYEHPNPSRVSDSLKAIKEDHLENNLFSLTGFYAPIMRANPDMISDLVQTARDLGSDMRKFVYFILRQCGSEQCLNELRKNPYGYSERGMKIYVSVKPFTVETLPLNSPASLDYVWADFLATGSDSGVRRIVKLVGDKWPLVESKKLDFGEMLIVGAAHWSLVSNAEQHSIVLQILKEESENLPALKKVLVEVGSLPQKESK